MVDWIKENNEENERRNLIFLKARIRNFYSRNKKRFPIVKRLIAKTNARGEEVLIEKETPLTLSEFMERYMTDEDVKISYQKYQTKMKEEFSQFRKNAEDFFKDENNK